MAQHRLSLQHISTASQWAWATKHCRQQQLVACSFLVMCKFSESGTWSLCRVSVHPATDMFPLPAACISTATLSHAEGRWTKNILTLVKGPIMIFQSQQPLVVLEKCPPISNGTFLKSVENPATSLLLSAINIPPTSTNVISATCRQA